jgi:hypothetical protein
LGHRPSSLRIIFIGSHSLPPFFGRLIGPSSATQEAKDLGDVRSPRQTTRKVLTVNSCIKVRLDLQADKSPVVVHEDMRPMHMTMIGAWNGVEEVQQGFPSQQGGPRLIRFESLRWRTKAIQVRVQFEVQERCAIKRTLRSHTESVLDVLYMVGSRIS